jgi:hypothetical protein
MFNLATVNGLVAGRVHCTFRRWETVRPKVGSRFTTRGIVIEVTSIEPVAEDELTDADAYEAGFDSLKALLRWTSSKGVGELYRIGIVVAGPDPRIALRTQLDDAELASLHTKLERMDRAADAPWTLRTLRQIEENPGVVSTALAAAVGQERAYYKIRVRRLKALGLTESLEVGYQLSPRGAVYLDSLCR